MLNKRQDQALREDAIRAGLLSAPWGCIGCTDAFFVPFRFGRSHLRAVEGGDGWYLPVPLSWLRIAKSIYVIHITLVNGMMDRLIGSRSRILIIPRLAVLEEMDISM
ncbi:hypothetical protein I309_00078 [Cryptococcus deuterogattii LA55]|nr:hypothetical protein I309_00078 [Cryptococcus deuterogattii LA55]KIR72639.1 hypothetical protein I310_03238 [Cryptococcus deuterogattii CA1014]KIR95179.1 hypothetical protein I304_01508 [Cryptococcus deuterogattii CBS 10090]